MKAAEKKKAENRKRRDSLDRESCLFLHFVKENSILFILLILLTRMKRTMRIENKVCRENHPVYTSPDLLTLHKIRGLFLCNMHKNGSSFLTHESNLTKNEQ